MKATEVQPGTFLDLKDVTLPALQGGGSGRRHVPNWVRSIREGRVYRYFTLGDFRVWKVRKDDEVKTRETYCLCVNRSRNNFFCPQHQALELSK